MRSTFLLLLGVFSVVLSGAFAATASDSAESGAESIRVKMVLSPPRPTGEPIFGRVKVFKVDRNNFGFFERPKEAHTVNGSLNRTLEFDLSLTPRVDYQILFEILDENGDPTNETYYFTGPGFATRDGSATFDIESDRVELNFAVGLQASDPDRGNFLVIVPKRTGEYAVILYFNEPYSEGV